ncbi:hypothetical protein KM043_006673 [Ampulex compressa]|nr:hypothetical protein KM043_006673 [Ampulex compressa]
MPTTTEHDSDDDDEDDDDDDEDDENDGMASRELYTNRGHTCVCAVRVLLAAPCACRCKEACANFHLAREAVSRRADDATSANAAGGEEERIRSSQAHMLGR